MYGKVDVTDYEAADEPQDVNGYLGKTKYYRTIVKEVGALGEEEFIDIFFKNNCLDSVMQTIREIDKDHNGYVTRTELDDILKLQYPELQDKDLIPVIKKFCSIQNKILIDYKSFRDWVKLGLKNRGFYAAMQEPKSANSQVQEKISQLQSKIDSMKDNEKNLQRPIHEFSEKGSSVLSQSNLKKFSALSKGRAQSCLSGQRSSSRPRSRQQSATIEPTELKRSILSRRGSENQARPVTSIAGSRSISRARKESGHFDNKLISVADYVKKNGFVDKDAPTMNKTHSLSTLKVKKTELKPDKKTLHADPKNNTYTDLVPTDDATFQKIIDYTQTLDYQF